MNFTVLFGTRPEIIKLMPIIRTFQKQGIETQIIHSGQHYSQNLSDEFLKEFNITIKQNLDVGSGTHAYQTSEIMRKLSELLEKNETDGLIVEGDTNTVLAGALTAVKMKIPVIHIEAGLRSFDMNMPEEINRLLTDHISDYCFTPTEIANENLLRENIQQGKIHLVGNTIADVLGEYQSKLKNIKEMNQALLTLHRPENVDKPETLKEIILAVNEISQENNITIVFPVHPRTRNIIENYGINTGKIMITQPLSYTNFLQELKKSRIILTDSGGIQEEACVLKKPCVTIRTTTERPETIKIGANYLAGIKKEGIKQGFNQMINTKKKWDNPYGENVSQKIVRVLTSK